MHAADYATLGAAGAGLFAASWVVLFFIRRYFSSISDIPGPFLASGSILWQLYHTTKGQIEHKVLQQHKRHGYFVRLSNNEVSCSHPDAAQAILQPQNRKADWYTALAVPDKAHATPMSELDPKRHRERSSITQQAYGVANLIKNEHILDEVMEELVTQLNSFADSGKFLQLDRWLNYFAFDIIGELTFSRRFGFVSKGKDIGDSVTNVRFLMWYQAVIGYVYWLHPIMISIPIFGWFGLQPHLHIFHQMHRVMDKRKAETKEHNDMVELWTKNWKKHPERMDESEIAAVAGMTQIAGSETMTAAMASIFYFMCKNPKCYDKLKKELDDAQKEGQLSDVIKDAEAKKLPYLQAVLKETLRYFPPVPFGFPRVAPKEGITVGDRHFKEGVVLSVNPYVYAHDPRYFGKDAAEYNPERWFRDEAPGYDKYMLQFSTGYNGCPGKQFAYAEIGKVAANLLRNFEFKIVDDKEWTVRSQFTAVQTDWGVTIKKRDWQSLKA